MLVGVACSPGPGAVVLLNSRHRGTLGGGDVDDDDGGGGDVNGHGDANGDNDFNRNREMRGGGVRNEMKDKRKNKSRTCEKMEKSEIQRK
jgi:hypothetical protein